jgi:hypothetical protein
MEKGRRRAAAGEKECTPAVVERKVIRPAALRLELDVFGAEVEPQPLVGPEADLTLVERPEAAENLATARD